MLIHNKHDIEFVTEFPCFLGHPVYYFLYFKKLFDSSIDTKTLNKFTTP